jgi:hypothetical protein
LIEGKTTNNKSFWIGFIVVFVVMQAYGYVVHDLMLSDTYQSLAAIFRAEAQMMEMMMAGSVATMLLFCYISIKGHEGKGIGEGVRYGILMGTFMSIPLAVDQYVVYPLPGDLAVVWFVVGVVGFAISGGIFAAICKPSAT